MNDWNSETKLSQNFKLKEFEKSFVAKRKNIDNCVHDKETFKSLEKLCKNIVQPIRNYYKIPFSPNSGYRSITLNRYIGSSDTSQHVLGQAVDLEIPGVNNEELFNFIKDELDFDQVILEYYDGVDPSSGWVHVSYVSNKDNRNRAMTFDGDHYRIVEE
jgi:uncharacterized protein YcbK (DUF882 family)|tara:strand:- start:1071 stop:1547 length:477 start_codon:yes stop_codon:yes gene_type:complete